MGRKSYLKVKCPKCGELGGLTYRRGLGFYVNHGKRTSHRIPSDVALEVINNNEYLSLIKYPGGDRFLLPYLLKMIPPHVTYVEVFGGSAQLLLNKTPSKVEIYNDIDGNLVNLFKVVKEHPHEFLAKLDLLPYSRELRFEIRRKLNNISDPVERAAMYFYLNRASFNGSINAGFSTSKKVNNARSYFNALNMIRSIYKRLRYVVIENLDFRDCIRKYDSKTTFFYLDPPHLYVTTEKDRDLYQVGFTEKDYIDLLNIIEKIKGKFLLKQSATTRILDNWIKEHNYIIREISIRKSMTNTNDQREHWRVLFIANYRI